MPCVAYKAYFLTIARVKEPFAMTNVLSAIGLVGLLASASIVVRYGRRRILLTGSLFICGCLQLMMAVTYDKHPGTPAAGKAIVALCSVFMFVYVVSRKIYDSVTLTRYLPSTLLGRGWPVFLPSWRRASFPTSTELHIWRLFGYRLPPHLDYYLYCAVLYQPRCSELGP